MNPPTIDQELLRDLILELRLTGNGRCLKLFNAATIACTRVRGHGGPCAGVALLHLLADRAFRFFAGLNLTDQPLVVQREARDVLQALGRALRPGEEEK